MNIVIIGAGALGTYYGARLEEAGANVTFVVREKRADNITQHGLGIKSPLGDYQIDRPNIETNVDRIESVDLVFLSVKGYHLKEALNTIEPLVAKGAYVLPILNGIEHIELLQERFGKEKIIGGLSHIIATLDEQGHVIHSSPFHNLTFGPLVSGQEEICLQFKSILSKTSLTYSKSDNVLLDLWEKYMFISAFSGITTATNLPIGPIREQEATLKVVTGILEEMKLLANTQHVHITDSHIKQTKKNLTMLDENATSSMHQDRRKGLNMELDHLHGGAIRLAEKLNIKIPYIETVYGIIKPFESIS